MIEIAIVEDDERERRQLLTNLQRYGREHQQAFSLFTFENALDFLEESRDFDIAFLDIMMPNMTGMEAARSLRKRHSKTVILFVTTMVQFAIASYEVDALDYIIKPVTYERLTMKLGRAIEVIQSAAGGTVVIKCADGIKKISSNDLLYVEVSGHRLTYHLTSGSIEGSGSLSELETILKAYDFMRCNACYLVNPHHIQQVSGKDLMLVLSNGEQLKISQSRRKAFITDMTNWLGQGKC